MEEAGWTSRPGVKQAASLGGMGLLAGALAGWAALLGAEGTAARAERVASLFRVLFLLLPVTLLAWSWLSRRQPSAAHATSLGRAVAGSLAVGLIGGLLAAMIFGVASTQILMLFGGTAAGEFQQWLIAEIGWPTIWSLVAVVAVTALVLGLMEYRHGRKLPGTREEK